MDKPSGLDRLVAILEEFKHELPSAYKQKNIPEPDLWLSPSEIQKTKILPYSRDALYAEIKIAEYCNANELDCDVVAGVHYVNQAKIDVNNVCQARYKINVTEFKKLLSKKLEERMPRRPLDKQLSAKLGFVKVRS
jgi:hypothetical protein